jgi:hypothetical protein
MPNEFVAQNGAAFHESTPISVTGCPAIHPKAKRAVKKKKKKAAAGRARKSSYDRGRQS